MHNTIDIIGEEETFKKYVERTLTEFRDDQISIVGVHGFSGFPNLKRLELPRASSIGSYFVDGSLNLEEIVIGTELDDICTVHNNQSLPNSIKNVYVPRKLVEKYKANSPWKYKPGIIHPYEEPISCISLRIEAYDQDIGNRTTTKIRYTALCTYKLGGVTQDGTMTFDGIVDSDEFPQNTSYTDAVQRTTTFTYLGITASATFTHGVYKDNYYIIETNMFGDFNWNEANDEYPVPGFNCYMSDYFETASLATMKVTTYGYSSITIYYKADGSANNYVYVSNKNASQRPYYTSDSLKYVGGKPNTAMSLDTFTSYEYTGLNDGDFFYIVFRRIYDNSVAGKNRGFLLLPQY